MADRWKAAFGFEKSAERALPSERNVHLQYSSDLQGLLELVRVAKRRALTNDFVKRWLVWVSWIAVAVILAAAVSRRLTGVLVVALIALGVSIAVTILQAWAKRASDYRVACKLDEAAGLQDRLSTALFLGSPEHTEPMVIQQRRDALRRLPGLDPKSLFPIRMPSYAIQTLTLALVAAALLGYRVHFKAPILALVQSAANSRVEKAVLSPLVGVVKKDLMALVNREPEVQQAAADAETVPGLPDAKNSDDPSQSSKDGMTPDGDWDEDSQASSAGDPTDVGDPQAGDAAAQGQGQDASQAADAPQNQQSADNNQPNPSENGNEKASAAQQQAGEQSSSANSSSMMQALKNLMKNMAGQPSSSPGESGGQPSAAGSSQQAGNSPGQGAKSDSSKDSDQKDTGTSPGSKKPGGGAGNGSTPVAKDGPKNAPPLPKNTVADRVDLESNNFRQQGRIRTTSAVGMAQLPLQDIKPQPVAAIKGAEQENIPVRYRLYVQRYFEHTTQKPSE
ncbi:MAG TPA: hypothetical protein VG322_02745 [Candidatus Acidoferrales bacterium]|nr:hypothetical protein [Candidatus Acidoferrales bacterium]